MEDSRLKESHSEYNFVVDGRDAMQIKYCFNFSFHFFHAKKSHPHSELVNLGTVILD